MKNDHAILASRIDDLSRATKGQWTPDLVHVRNLGRNLEMPASVEMSEIAELARTGLWDYRVALSSSERT
jgi:hypothetical protein